MVPVPPPDDVDGLFQVEFAVLPGRGAALRHAGAAAAHRLDEVPIAESAHRPRPASRRSSKLNVRLMEPAELEGGIAGYLPVLEDDVEPPPLPLPFAVIWEEPVSCQPSASP